MKYSTIDLTDPHVLAHFQGKFVERDCGYETPCLVFTGYCNKQGYGQYSYEGVQKLAHRVAYMIAHNMTECATNVLHKCDNPPCGNPAHLFLGTRMENTQDMMRKGRNPDIKGEDRVGAILTEADVKQIRAWRANIGFSFRELGEMFGVADTTISAIIHRYTWRHL